MNARFKKKAPLYLTIGALIAIILILIAFFFIIASHEQFRLLSSPAVSPTATPGILWAPYSNDYFSLSYPNSAREQDLEKDANLAVVLGWVLHQSSPQMRFATQVLYVPEMTTITDFPAVAFRRIKKNNYIQEPITVDGITGVQFSRHADSDNPAEFGAFLFRNKRIYTFVLQAKDEAYADQTYKRILSTISFASEVK